MGSCIAIVIKVMVWKWLAVLGAPLQLALTAITTLFNSTLFSRKARGFPATPLNPELTSSESEVAGEAGADGGKVEWGEDEIGW